MSMQGWQALHSLTRDASVKERRLTPGTTKPTARNAKASGERPLPSTPTEWRAWS